jgi:hypothetical protein
MNLYCWFKQDKDKHKIKQEILQKVKSYKKQEHLFYKMTEN